MSKYDRTVQQSICLSTKVRCAPCAILHILIRDERNDIFNRIIAHDGNVIAISIPLRLTTNPLFIKFKHYRQTYANTQLIMQPWKSFRATMNNLVVRRIVVKLPNTYIVKVPLGDVESSIYIFNKCCIETNTFDISDPCFYTHLENIGIFLTPKRRNHYKKQPSSLTGTVTAAQGDQRSYPSSTQMPHHICSSYLNRTDNTSANNDYGYIIDTQEECWNTYPENQQQQATSNYTPTTYTRKRRQDGTLVKNEGTTKFPTMQESTQFSTQYQYITQPTPAVEGKYMVLNKVNFPKLETSTGTQSTNPSYVIINTYTDEHTKTEGSHYNRVNH